MSLPELFRHRDRFIGCIAIGRVPRKRLGEKLRVGKYETVLDETGVAAFDAIADTLLHRAGDTFSLTTQGYDYPSLARCPALEEDGRCAIHFDGKPLTCEVVPLDPLVPDALQHLVLAGRNQSAAYLGTDCIQEGDRADGKLMVAEGRIEDEAARDALARRRESLATESKVWGRPYSKRCAKSYSSRPPRWRAFPRAGF